MKTLHSILEENSAYVRTLNSLYRLNHQASFENTIWTLVLEYEGSGIVEQEYILAKDRCDKLLKKENFDAVWLIPLVIDVIGAPPRMHYFFWASR